LPFPSHINGFTTLKGAKHLATQIRKMVVKTVPLTGVSLSKEGFDTAMHRASNKLGCFFYCWAILAIPVVTALLLWMLVFGVAGFVFAIQALVVGSATYQESCQNRYGVWMIVFGSLIMGSTFFSCCCIKPANKEDEEDKKRENPCQWLITLINLANFGWLCYGINIIYSNPTDICNQSQYDVFKLIVMFMFWGSIAILAACLFLCISVLPVVAFAADEVRSDLRKRDDDSREANPNAADIEKGDGTLKPKQPIPVAAAQAVVEKPKTSENEQQVAAV